jgi:16S rRNA (guanine966-N2)-methyltransferase
LVKIIAGHWKGRRIKTIEGKGCRPAMGKVRAAIFSMLDSRGINWESTRVLDVFAGSGSLGWEALSRGASQVWFLESDARVARLLREQAPGFALPGDLAPGQRVRVLLGDALRILARPAAQGFDLLFFDPPYGHDLLAAALRLAEAGGWIAPKALVCAEVEAPWDLTALDLSGFNLSGFNLLVNRVYGQTRILLWEKTTVKNGSPCTPEPSTP